jgi:hypothetical protein
MEEERQLGLRPTVGSGLFVGNVPQGLKPGSLMWRSSARINPCPFKASPKCKQRPETSQLKPETFHTALGTAEVVPIQDDFKLSHYLHVMNPEFVKGNRRSFDSLRCASVAQDDIRF